MMRRSTIRPKRHQEVKVTKDGRTILYGAAYAKLRKDVYSRDKAICQIETCGGYVQWEDFELDHWRREDGTLILSRGMGGAWRSDTMFCTRTTHRWCNRNRVTNERPSLVQNLES